MKNPCIQPQSRINGFTLVELLVVITIVAVLVALSLAGYTKFRSAADKAIVMGILREIQVANGNFAADNNGKFVPASGKDEDGKVSQWHKNRDFLDNLRGFSNQENNSFIAMNFPPEKLDKKTKSLASPRWDHVSGNYGAFEVDPTNNTWGTTDWESAFTIAQLSTPSRTAAFATSLDWRIKNGTNYTGTETRTGQGRMAYRHDGKALVVFYDGHVEAITMADMDKIMKNGGKNHPFWKGNN